jgi:competence protein ComEC
MVRGDRVEFVAALAPPQRFVVPELGDDRPGRARAFVVLSGGALDVYPVARGRGLGASIDRARAHVRARIEATFPARTESLARALVLGETDLSPEDSRDFRDGGLSHLLAVSGMHLVLAVNLVVAALTALFARFPRFALRVVPVRAASLSGLGLTWIYCDFAGGSGSAVRAACMLSVQLACVALGLRTRPLRALGWSLGLVALVDPLALFDVSFSLSAAATLGLVALGGPFSKLLGERGPSPVRALGKSLATTLAATVPCAPILLRMGPALSLGGLVANLIAVPLGELFALPLCLVHTLLAPLPAAEKGTALAGGGALLAVQKIAHATAAFTPAQVPLPLPTDAQLAALSAAALVLALGSGLRVRLAGGGLGLVVVALAEVVARREGAPHGLLRVTFLDVGQGDAALVDLPNGEAILVDAGGLVGSPIDTGERVIAPVLRARRRRSLRAVIVSHPHPDHFMGLRAALAGIRVEELWDTGEAAESAPPVDPDRPVSPFGPQAYLGIVAELTARGTRVRRPSSLCKVHEMGGVEVSVLAPCPGFSPLRDTNDNSFVVRFRLGERSVLFVGDAEHGTEKSLVETRSAELHADVLKVGHHGSRSSTRSSFLDAVAPSFAVISCGVRNRYGHPHVSTLETLATRPLRLFRTDLDGAVTFVTDGRQVSVEGASSR